MPEASAAAAGGSCVVVVVLAHAAVAMAAINSQDFMGFSGEG
jgi:hypothetical protein